MRIVADHGIPSLIVATAASSFWPCLLGAAAAWFGSQVPFSNAARWRHALATVSILSMMAVVTFVLSCAITLQSAHAATVHPMTPAPLDSLRPDADMPTAEMMPTNALWDSPPTWTAHLTDIAVATHVSTWWILAFGWFCSTVVLLVRFARTWRFHGELLKRARPVQGNLAAVCQRIAAKAGVSNSVDVRVSDEWRGACIVGLIRPRILIGSHDLRELPNESLELILYHEYVHVQRRDHLINALLLLVSILLFFQPAIHWLAWRVRAEREYLTDDGAIASAGVSPVRYGRALVDLELLLAQTSAHTVLDAGGGELHVRIRRLLAPNTRVRPRMWQMLLPLVTSAMLFVLGARQAVVAASVTGNVLMRQQLDARADHGSVNSQEIRCCDA